MKMFVFVGLLVSAFSTAQACPDSFNAKIRELTFKIENKRLAKQGKALNDFYSTGSNYLTNRTENHLLIYDISVIINHIPEYDNQGYDISANHEKVRYEFLVDAKKCKVKDFRQVPFVTVEEPVYDDGDSAPSEENNDGPVCHDIDTPIFCKIN